MKQLIWKFQQLSNFQQGLLAAVLSGLLLWWSFNFHSIWVLVFVAILPLLFVHYNLQLKAWQDFLVGFIAGFIMAGGVMSWHWEVFPVSWAGINSQMAGILLILYVWGLSSVMGGIVGFWSLAVHYLKRNNFFDFLLLPALWVTFEFIRSIAISLLWAGPGAAYGPHWSIAFQGYTLASSKLFLPLASIGGVYLLSFIVIFINLIIFFGLSAYLTRGNWKKYLIPLVALIVITLVFDSWFYLRNNNFETVKVAVVNTYFPSFSQMSQEDLAEDILKKAKILSDIKNSEQGSEIIILPEDFRLLASLIITDQQKFISDLFGQEKDLLIIDSARIVKAGETGAKLRFMYLEVKTGSLVESDKLFLVPHGEYLPYLSDWLLQLSGLQKWADGFREARSGIKGEKATTIKFKDFEIGAVACSEVLSPSLNRTLVEKNNSAFIINSASDALFNGSGVLSEQAVNLAKLRAVENNRYYVQSANFVPSFIIDNKGQLIKKGEWFENAVIYADVGIVKKHSFYNFYGRLLMPIFILGIIILAIVNRFFPTTLTKNNSQDNIGV